MAGNSNMSSSFEGDEADHSASSDGENFYDEFDYDSGSGTENVPQGILYDNESSEEDGEYHPELNWLPDGKVSPAHEFKMKRADFIKESTYREELERVEEEWIPTDKPFGSVAEEKPTLYTEEGQVLKILPGGSYLILGSEESVGKTFFKYFTLGFAVAIPFGVVGFLLFVALSGKL